MDQEDSIGAPSNLSLALVRGGGLCAFKIVADGEPCDGPTDCCMGVKECLKSTALFGIRELQYMVDLLWATHH